MAAEYLKKLEKEQKVKIKRKAAQMKKEESQAKRAARTCSTMDCLTYTKKEGGAQGWSKCEHCGMLFCKKHKAEHILHATMCAKEEDEEDNSCGVAV